MSSGSLGEKARVVVAIVAIIGLPIAMYEWLTVYFSVGVARLLLPVVFGLFLTGLFLWLKWVSWTGVGVGWLVIIVVVLVIYVVGERQVTVFGLIVDKDGNGWPQKIVVLTDAHHIRRETATTESGAFDFPNIPEGVFGLCAEGRGAFYSAYARSGWWTILSPRMNSGTHFVDFSKPDAHCLFRRASARLIIASLRDVR